MTEREQSEFNMAVSFLNRLNALFYAADEAAISLDANTWFHILMSLERELSTEMKPDELKEYQQKRAGINDLIVKNSQSNARHGRNEITSELYDELHSYELKLRRVLREAGLQTKVTDDASRALK